MTEGRQPQAKFLIASDNPFFISTIYPITKIDTEELTLLDQIEDGYSLWGSYLFTLGRTEYRYFTSPISYPFSFTDKGIKKIKEKLKKIEEIEPTSIREASLPNILPSDLRTYSSMIPKEKVIREKFIIFKIKDWDDVEFLRFPTFLVMNIDKSLYVIESINDWKKMSAYWRQKVEALNENKKFKRELGITESPHLVDNVPNLAFVSSRWLFYGKNTNEAQTLPSPGSIIKECPFLEGHSNWSQATIIGVNNLLHEFIPILDWRIYYSDVPWFYKGDWRLSVSPGGVVGNPGKLIQILRTVLMVHVTMPAFAERCQILEYQLERDILHLQKERSDFFNEFSTESINRFHSTVKEKVKDYQNITIEVDRISEVLLGYDQLLAFATAPFKWRPSDTLHNEGLGTRIFHFLQNEDTHNDRRVSERYRELITTRLDSIKKKYARPSGGDIRCKYIT